MGPLLTLGALDHFVSNLLVSFALVANALH